MDSSSQVSATYEKPCVTCRKRKIKCDKVRPCANCQRFGHLCSYGDNSSDYQQHLYGSNGDVKGDGDLRARLERLERLLASKDQDIQYTVPSTERAASSYLGTSICPTLKEAQRIDSENSNGQSGQLIFQDGHSIYFVGDFWAGLIDEVL